jgi:hypothetical protein
MTAVLTFISILLFVTIHDNDGTGSVTVLFVFGAIPGGFDILMKVTKALVIHTHGYVLW